MKQEEINEKLILKAKISRIVNITLTILSVVVMIITAFLFATNVISKGVAGLLIPGSLAVYLLMGVLSNINEKRKSVMILYIVLLSLSILVFYFDLIYFQIHS